MNMTILYANISFTATSNAEVKYEATKTDPEIAVIGVDEHFMTNSGLETNLGRNLRVDIDNNNYVCVVGSDFGKVYLKISTLLTKQYRYEVPGSKWYILKEKGSTFGNKQDLRVLIPIQVARSLFTAPKLITRWASWFLKKNC
jgi:putative ABC transport system permease protein